MGSRSDVPLSFSVWSKRVRDRVWLGFDFAELFVEGGLVDKRRGCSRHRARTLSSFFMFHIFMRPFFSYSLALAKDEEAKDVDLFTIREQNFVGYPVALTLGALSSRALKDFS